MELFVTANGATLHYCAALLQWSKAFLGERIISRDKGQEGHRVTARGEYKMEEEEGSALWIVCLAFVFSMTVCVCVFVCISTPRATECLSGGGFVLCL